MTTFKSNLSGSVPTPDSLSLPTPQAEGRDSRDLVEITSPTDIAEEVWLIFVKNRLIIIANLEKLGEVSKVKWNLFTNN